MKKSLILKIEETITGFTLAEVLITLTIIGVIAALTIPALITNIQDAQLHTAWKKIYSDINQDMMRIVSDNGGSIAGLCGDGGHSCLKNLFLPYFSYTKTCTSTQSPGNCWHNGTDKYLNGTLTGFGGAGIVLNNGALLSFESAYTNASTCTNTDWNGSTPKCGVLEVDVNGFNGPDIVGKDIYMIILQKDSVKPFGVYGDSYAGTCSTWGIGCSADYLKR